MNKLYYPDTHMIYDYLTKETAVESAEDYPTAEEIRISAPNPCGWGTGMEDSTLNLSSMTEAILARYALTKDNGLKPQPQMLLEGLIKNATAAESGFIARSICAADGTSVYIDSSKDQYTNWVYAAHRLLHNVWADRPTFKWLRNVGESVIIQCTCPDYKMTEWEKEMFFTFIKEADFVHATNYWPVLFCDAWWLAKEKGPLF